MWSIEDVLSELKEEEEKNKERSGGLPPGFRFHPTDEELITFYLASKVFNHPPSNYPNLPTLTTPSLLFGPAVHIPEVDLNRCEPWDLPERAKMGEREWYFYSVRDRKYPTGLRTNRATGSGYWKATGKDKHVYATTNNNNNNNYKTNKKSNYSYHGDHHESALIGMKKTLVFYQGRAPRGVKTPWVMHEYRLDGHFSSFRLSSSKEEWVICRIFHKHAGSGGNENKKSRPCPTNYINNFMMSSCLPPLLETPTTTTTTTCSLPPPPPLPSLLSYLSSPSFLHPTSLATTSTATLPPFSSAPLDHFPQLSQCPDEDTLPSLSAIAMNMKQENNQQNWLDKILSPQHQLIHLNPNYYDHDQNVLGDLADDDKFTDLIHPSSSFGAPDCFPDHAEMSASLAAAAALDRLLDHPPLFQPL